MPRRLECKQHTCVTRAGSSARRSIIPTPSIETYHDAERWCQEQVQCGNQFALQAGRQV